ncbi:unnamed protein product [Brassicogethes aeneus]|uniref:Uncharacterized protein n=1 Tax=Brassicogethes aeneus TaxID=1431903 RepID=A0A9P0B815_BRAAE|nr:unnamed protein product [Brassicogethes aeneus]
MPSTSITLKPKKPSKEKEKRKSQTGQIELNNHVGNDKGSPVKDNNNKQYAGIGPESICIYAEHLSEDIYKSVSEDFRKSREICNILTEDINYKLRYIIHDALLKAKLCGRNNISSKDISQSFEGLQLEKVYGASSNPNWLPLTDQLGTINCLYLDDTKINLMDLAEEEQFYTQPGDLVISKSWYPEEISNQLKQYFTTVCQSVVSSDCKLRQTALKDISENPKIGPIIEWFYHFGYLLLSKDITYDCLTLRALELIDTLESSPLGSANVSEKQLKLLVRLLLQRLLKSVTTDEVLKPMCSILANLCLRVPLREFVIQKINQKLHSLFSCPLNVLMIVSYIGIDAIREIFLPNTNYFLGRVVQRNDCELLHTVLSIYNIICRAEIHGCDTYHLYHRIFGDGLVPFWRHTYIREKAPPKENSNHEHLKVQLLRTRKKIIYDSIKKKKELHFDSHYTNGINGMSLEEVLSLPMDNNYCDNDLDKVDLSSVFDLPTEKCRIKTILDDERIKRLPYIKETSVTIGKMSLSLPLSVLNFHKPKFRSKCCNHTLLQYNL